jgi:hypothetical protein
MGYYWVEIDTHPFARNDTFLKGVSLSEQQLEKTIFWSTERRPKKSIRSDQYVK